MQESAEEDGGEGRLGRKLEKTEGKSRDLQPSATALLEKIQKTGIFLNG